MSNLPSRQIQAVYFDGQSSRVQAVMLSFDAPSTLLIQHLDGVLVKRIPAQAIRWPERTRHGARIAHLPDGASVQSRDSLAWDSWFAQHAVAHGQQESAIVRLQQSWRGVGVALALLVVGAGAFYKWGLPVAAQGIVALVPYSADAALGRTALAQVDQQWMQPSELPQAVQTRLRDRFAKMVRQSMAMDDDLKATPYELVFRKSSSGPNAFALPGGTLVLTDELVLLLNDDDVMMGVLGHELGHVRYRHGMRQLVHVAALQAALGAAFGDYASILAYAPLVMGAMGYSRDHEREADAHALGMLRSAGISPKVMVKFFEAARAAQQAKAKAKAEGDASSPGSPPVPGISIMSTHPADQERIEFFERAVQ